MKKRVAFKGGSLLLISIHFLWPAVILAQTPQPAGVVSTLTGQASLAPAARPQEPRSLKFRDDLFYQDRISTRERSIVRVLLGGKAVVTVRELSNLTITEEPGLPSTVNLEAGKVSLGVARSRMGPGETIEVRTPNAIVAVRGTFLVVEVAPAPTAQLTPAPVVFNTSVYLFEGSADLFNIDRSSRLTMGALETVSVLGNTVGQIRPLPPTAATVILKDLKAPASAQHGDTPETVKEAVSQQQQAQALALSETLAPMVTAQVSTTQTTTAPTTQNTINPLTQTNVSEIAATPIKNGGFESGTFSGWTTFAQSGSLGDGFIQSGTSSPISGFAVPAPPEGSFAAMTDQNGPGSYTLHQDFTVPSTNPMLRFSRFIGNRTVDFFIPLDGTLDFTVAPNQQARADIMRTTAGFQDVESSGNVLSNLLKTLPGDALVQGYDTFTFDLSQFAGQTVRLRFAEVDTQNFFQAAVDDVAVFSRVVLQDDLIRLSGDGLLRTSSTRPHLRLEGENHEISTNPDAAMFNLKGRDSAVGSVEVEPGLSLNAGTDRPIRGESDGGSGPLSQPLLETAGAVVATNQAVKLDTALLEATAPLFRALSGSVITASKDFINLAQKAHLSADLLPSDALIKLNASTLTVTSGSLFNVAGGSLLNVNGSLFSLANGSTLTLSNGALVTVSGGSVFTLTGGSLGTFGSGTNTLNITNATCLGTCASFGGIPVALVNGALNQNVSVNAGFAPFAGLGPTNKVNLNGAVLVVDGPSSKVKLGF